ncbi:hypothetical protein [Acinetobacter baumannii]|uniref:hypothetical protein n=1 Tax=Acinetobacter baumannii TaxID=470 RepID=UPI0002891D95|nr:hypothetical protein [Acinetobacter baumannii]EKP31548.1 hypothetical protein ACIN5087_1811 [Acinetobacter baumannii OIFC087]EME0413055.1 hypothetical protein [Acinetobacter baumannii]KRI44454.1 hypothetical protein APC20_16500 [Acinetobacter baumannii]MCY6388070.1 hypothetical protein [Acinetobacter baumannii]MDC3926303.1 hypothetical protein [Acinetobacter baumannii]
MTTDIHTWRSLICQDLIKAGLTNSKDIVAQASNIEVYVFGDTKTAEAKPEIKNAEVKTSNPVKTQTVKETKAEKVEEVQETKSETAPVEEPKDEVVEETTKSEITKKEVKDACLEVVKEDRAALEKILSDVGASTVATIPADKYADVIAACEKALA